MTAPSKAERLAAARKLYLETVRAIEEKKP